MLQALLEKTLCTLTLKTQHHIHTCALTAQLIPWSYAKDQPAVFLFKCTQGADLPCSACFALSFGTSHMTAVFAQLSVEQCPGPCQP